MGVPLGGLPFNLLQMGNKFHFLTEALSNADSGQRGDLRNLLLSGQTQWAWNSALKTIFIEFSINVLSGELTEACGRAELSLCD